MTGLQATTTTTTGTLTKYTNNFERKRHDESVSDLESPANTSCPQTTPPDCRLEELAQSRSATGRFSAYIGKISVCMPLCSRVHVMHFGPENLQVHPMHSKAYKVSKLTDHVPESRLNSEL